MSWNPFKGSDQTGVQGSGNTGSWMNMETSQMRAAATGDLTGEASAFESFGYKLSRQERLLGFISCTGVGFLLSLVGTIMLFIGLTSVFAILYSIGIVVSLVGTGFLIGFLKQLKQMFKPVRVVATGIMIAAFVLVWIFAFIVKSAVLSLIFVVILYLAYLWYTLSYIPFARGFVKSMFSRFF